MTNAKSNGASPSSPSQEVVDYFVRAARAGNNAAVTDFLDKYGLDCVDEKSNFGYTALMCAAEFGHGDTVALLLENGAAINATDNGGDAALAWAVIGGHKDIVLLLLEKGADVDAENHDGKTALWWAGVRGHAEAAALLQQWSGAQRRQQQEQQKQQEQQRQKELELAAAAATEARMEKLRRLRPAKSVLKKVFKGTP